MHRNAVDDGYCDGVSRYQRLGESAFILRSPFIGCANDQDLCILNSGVANPLRDNRDFKRPCRALKSDSLMRLVILRQSSSTHAEDVGVDINKCFSSAAKSKLVQRASLVEEEGEEEEEEEESY